MTWPSRLSWKKEEKEGKKEVCEVWLLFRYNKRRILTFLQPAQITRWFLDQIVAKKASARLDCQFDNGLRSSRALSLWNVRWNGKTFLHRDSLIVLQSANSAFAGYVSQLIYHSLDRSIVQITKNLLDSYPIHVAWLSREERKESEQTNRLERSFLWIHLLRLSPLSARDHRLI